MVEADRTYAVGLAALRQATELTRVELARPMGVTQAAISRLEQPHDLLLSTLNPYLQTIGGTARMMVRFADGHKATLDLGELTNAAATRPRVCMNLPLTSRTWRESLGVPRPPQQPLLT